MAIHKIKNRIKNIYLNNTDKSWYKVHPGKVYLTYHHDDVQKKLDEYGIKLSMGTVLHTMIDEEILPAEREDVFIFTTPLYEKIVVGRMDIVDITKTLLFEFERLSKLKKIMNKI